MVNIAERGKQKEVKVNQRLTKVKTTVTKLEDSRDKSSSKSTGEVHRVGNQAGTRRISPPKSDSDGNNDSKRKAPTSVSTRGRIWNRRRGKYVMPVDIEHENEVYQELLGGVPVFGKRGTTQAKGIGKRIVDPLVDIVTLQASANQLGIPVERLQQIVSGGDGEEDDIGRTIRQVLKYKIVMQMIGGDGVSHREPSRSDKLMDLAILKMIGDDKVLRELFGAQSQISDQRSKDKDTFYSTLLEHQGKANELQDKLRADLMKANTDLLIEKMTQSNKELQKAVEEGKQDDITKLTKKMGGYEESYKMLSKIFGKQEGNLLQDVLGLLTNKESAKVIGTLLDRVGGGLQQAAQTVSAQKAATVTRIPAPPPRAVGVPRLEPTRTTSPPSP